MDCSFGPADQQLNFYPVGQKGRKGGFVVDDMAEIQDHYPAVSHTPDIPYRS